MELTEEKSRVLALAIEMTKIHLHLFDAEYAKEAARRLREQADRQRAILVLHPGHDDTRNQLLIEQANALQRLAEFKESVQRCQDLKDKIGENSEIFDRIKMLFL